MTTEQLTAHLDRLNAIQHPTLLTQVTHMGKLLHMNDTPYSIGRLAEATGRSRSTILRAINDGTLHAIKLGDATSAWVIPATDAHRYIASVKAAA